ncbi:hypothetical protein MKEN_00898700 [Mycena kentingensis (nom. inval.)]|nr:hypothetical protein MKEN_00898700 [Mycena kentingensis (nom. inval.)]
MPKTGRWTLPEDEVPNFEISGDSYRCRICRGEARASSKASKFIQHTSLKKHLESATHINSRESRGRRLRAEREEAARLDAPYAAAGILDYRINTVAGLRDVQDSMFPPPEDTRMEVDSNEHWQPVPRDDTLELERLVSLRESELAIASDEAEPVDAESIHDAYKRLLTEAIARGELGLGEDDDGEEDAAFPNGDDEDDADFFRSVDLMLLDILDNLPRCRFSGTQMSLFLRFAHALGVPNIPTLKGLRKVQQQLQTSCFTEPIKVQSFLGNVFYVNDIRDVIAHDLANPTVAPKMRFHPEETVDGRPISEIWQAERWSEYRPDELTPMITRGSRHFWIDELARRTDGTFVIPLAFVFRNDVLCTYARFVSRTSLGVFHVDEDSPVEIFPVDELERDYAELTRALDAGIDNTLSWTVESRGTVPTMPNGMRQKLDIDEDTDLVVIMVDAYQDDTSGNSSRQFDKHIITCIRNGNLPNRILQQPYHCHCVASSQHASSAEQMAAFRDQIKSTETKPIRCYNVHTQRKTAVVLRALVLPGDNPQQSEDASHIGCNANRNCRKGNWGGTAVEKTAAAMYHQCHLGTEVKRTADETRQRLREQLRLATRGDLKAIKEHWTATGTKDKVTGYWIEQALAQFTRISGEDKSLSVDEISAQVQTWLDKQPGDKMNPLLDITGLDPTQDTPVEILHTILLGAVKYVWHFMHSKVWSDEHRALLAIRLQSMDISGLSIPAIRAGYIMQYRNALVGKHFKSLMQTLAFHVHDICNPEQFALIKATADLGARVWIPEIDDMDMYIADLNVAIGNLLDAFDAVDPLRILVKIKLHLLAHLPDDIRRFGPGIRFSTEIFEACNAVFRACSVRSNRLAPSRDISRKFASLERVKHILSGGYWFDASTASWVQASAAARGFVVEQPEFQRHLGWSPVQAVECGLVRMPSQKKEPAVQWRTTAAAAHWTCRLGEAPDPNSSWRMALTIVAKNGDVVRRRGWVYALGLEGEHVLGRVAEIAVGSAKYITLERFICTDIIHADYRWPVARRPNSAEIISGISSFVVIPPEAVLFICNVVHDCRFGRCKPAISGKVVQEREETMQDRSLIKHTDDDRFVLNLAGFHNFMELRRLLPPQLTELQPLHPNREVFHREMALRAQDLRRTKREKTAAKRRAATAEKRRLAAEAAAEATAAEAAASGDQEQRSTAAARKRRLAAEKKRLAAIAAAEAEAALAAEAEAEAEPEEEQDLEDSDMGEEYADEPEDPDDLDFIGAPSRPVPLQKLDGVRTRAQKKQLR